MFEKMTGLVTMFKVGDLVQVRHHTEEEKANCYPRWADPMSDMEGKTYPIHRVTYEGCILKDEDGFKWVFSTDSLCHPYEQF